MVYVMRISLLLAESRSNNHKCAWRNYLLTLIGSFQDSLCQVCGAVSFYAACAIKGHQHKKFYSPAGFNEFQV